MNTALYYWDATIAARASAALGYPSASKHYTALADKIAAAFNRHFGNASHDGYGDGTQVTSILPIVFGIVPPSWQHAVYAHLVQTVAQDGYHLETGIFGTRYLIDALVMAGRPDVALAVLNQRTYPGFGWQIAHGATTDWEEWTYLSSMEDYDHAMFAGINAALLTEFGGIAPTAPGYQQIQIAPSMPSGLSYVSEKLDTVRGLVASSWRRVGTTVHLTVVIPPNATATVLVPKGSEPVSASRGVQLAGYVDGKASFQVGSGEWSFSTNG